MFTSLALVVLAGLAGPLLAAGRRPRIPVLVGELGAGALLGQTGLHLIDPAAQPFPAFSQIGFAMLMLVAGTEVDLDSPPMRAGFPRGVAAFAIVLAAGIAAGFGVAAAIDSPEPLLFGVLLAGSSAAVAFPIIGEYRLAGAAIAMLIAWTTIADAVTALLMPLTIVGSRRVPLALLGDAAIIMLAAVIIVIGDRAFRTPLAHELRRESKQRHWALRLRASVLMLLVLAAIAEHTGASLLIAGFAAGIVLRRFREPHRLELELTGLASGFFVPAFFVLLGASLDLRRFIESPQAIVLALLMACLAAAVHVLAALIAGRERRFATGLLASAQLGLPAAAASIGLANHILTPPIAAALVAGGLLTLIPATAGAILLRRRAASADTAATV